MKSRTAEILSSYYERLAARDEAGLQELLSPDIVVTYYAQPDQLPWAGTFTGHDGFNRFLGIVSAHMSIVEADRSDPIVSNEHAVVRTTGTWRADATGKLVSGGMINVFTIVDGQISGYEVWADTAAFVEALRPDN